MPDPDSGFSPYKIGPGLIITAAFVGPGTLTTCTLAGSDFGYSLLWVLIFAVLATYTLQEMSGRLGMVGGMGLGEALDQELPGRSSRLAGVVVVVSALGVGNAAYQTGNFLGASLALSAMTETSVRVWPAFLAAAAFTALWYGSYKVLVRVLCGFVLLMSVCFISTAILARPQWSVLLEGMLLPRLSGDSIYVALGLVGTTIVPYDLFLYSSMVKEKTPGFAALRPARLGLLAAVVIGGIISMAIITTASAAFHHNRVEITDAADMAVQLEPLLGGWAKITIAVGLFGAGMSSAITAPLAAGFAICGILGWSTRVTDTRFRLVWCGVLLAGALFASLGFQPLSAILFAQASNGVLLPVVTLFLLYVANSQRLLGLQVNSWKANLAGGLVVFLTFVLGGLAIARTIRLLMSG